MADDEDWLLRPVIEGCISYESLVNGTVDLVDIARLNHALDVKVENERRYQEANQE